MSIFQQTRRLYNVTTRQIAQVTGIHVDELWTLEETGRGTAEMWQKVINALNRIAKTGYEPTNFSGMTCTNYLLVQVE
jgi:hypothetical protein